MEKRHISWEEFHSLTRELAGRIEDSGFAPDVLIGVTRGGLVPLAILGEVLGTKNVTTVSARSYDGVERGKLDVFVQPEVDLHGKKVLLVDEITDSGETFRQLAEIIKARYQPAELKTAVVVVNTEHCDYMPDYFVDETKIWVVFPWQEWPRRKREEA